MTIWLVLWGLMSIGLLSFTGWTAYVLQRQKKAWKAFSKKYKLRYEAGSFMESPALNGVIGGYTVGIFVGVHGSEDERRARKLSAIEITMDNFLPAEGAVASADMVPLVQDLNFKAEMKPDHKDWQDDYIATTTKKAVLERYLTADRLEKILGLMKLENAAVILIFRDDVMLLRFDTPDPFVHPAHMDRVVKQMIDAAKVLELKDELPGIDGDD